MTRRKIEMKRIQNEDYRKVTYSKRRAGLIKKARFLSSRFNTQIAIVSCSLSGRLFTFGHPSVDSVVDQFLDNYTIDSRGSSSNESSPDNTHGPSSSSKGSRRWGKKGGVRGGHCQLRIWIWIWMVFGNTRLL
ncbi:hypothetical protein OIU84_013478 [Salix udensis]|uniref:MADS-box domain-containing protein n=1 Tax=Salix udensis TaxID=889485 RepID=A0AAD6NU42_9ROSI|nr:hypothetical protein OIU84_013478 [Salix udensis]